MKRARLPRWASYAVLAAALAHNTWRSWLCWGDLVSDCGRDLDIALAILKGVPLYAQATYLYGPLPPFLNAGLFLLFGLHANVLMAAGWLSAVAATALVYRIVKLFADRWTATWCGVAFLYLCAFGNYSMNAIFNWMLPYTYAATYGMLFAVASLYLLLKHIRRPRGVLVWLSALCAAGAALCKLEALLPCCALHALYLVFLVRTRAPAWKAAASAYAGALVLVLSVYGWFWHTTGPALVSGNILLRGSITAASLHRATLGLTVPLEALALVGGSCLGFAAALLAARLAEGLRGGREAFVPAAAGGVFAAVCVGYAFFPLTACLRVLPFLFTFGFGAAAIHAWREREASAWMRASLYLFCLACLWRVFFQVWAHHFGFYLLVAPLAALGVSLHDLREAPVFRKVHSRVWAGMVGGLLAGLCVQHALASDAYYRQYSVDVRAPRGHVKLKDAGGLGSVEAGLVRFLEGLPPGTRVLPFPQGLGVVFFSGQENSNRALLFYPVNFMDAADEDAMLRDLEARPPDVVLWGMGGDFVDYGRGAFGKGFAQRVCAWIEARYEPWMVVGEGDVVRVMRPRRAAAEPAAP